jgi:hypothetical protein
MVYACFRLILKQLCFADHAQWCYWIRRRSQSSWEKAVPSGPSFEQGVPCVSALLRSQTQLKTNFKFLKWRPTTMETILTPWRAWRLWSTVLVLPGRQATPSETKEKLFEGVGYKGTEPLFTFAIAAGIKSARISSILAQFSLVKSIFRHAPTVEASVRTCRIWWTSWDLKVDPQPSGQNFWNISRPERSKQGSAQPPHPTHALVGLAINYFIRVVYFKLVLYIEHVDSRYPTHKILKTLRRALSCPQYVCCHKFNWFNIS